MARNTLAGTLNKGFSIFVGQRYSAAWLQHEVSDLFTGRSLPRRRATESFMQIDSSTGPRVFEQVKFANHNMQRIQPPHRNNGSFPRLIVIDEQGSAMWSVPKFRYPFETTSCSLSTARACVRSLQLGEHRPTLHPMNFGCFRILKARYCR